MHEKLELLKLRVNETIKFMRIFFISSYNKIHYKHLTDFKI